MLHKKNGITLISLVVTIVVLIILAGISIDFVIGDNNILKISTNAKKSYEEAYMREQVEIAKSELTLNKQDVTAENIKNYLVDSNIISNDDAEVQSKDEYTDTFIIGSIQIDIPIPSVTLYFEKGENWDTENIYAYVWIEDDSGEVSEYLPYPGVQTTLVEGTDNIYSYTVPKAYEGSNIIFNNSTNKIQTIDLEMPGDGFIFRLNDSTSRDVYLREVWPNASIYFWSDSIGEYSPWPGETLDSFNTLDNYYFYKYTLPEGYDKFIFAKLNETGSSTGQTPDLTFAGGNKLYNASGSYTIYSNGFWEKYISE